MFAWISVNKSILQNKTLSMSSEHINAIMSAPYSNPSLFDSDVNVKGKVGWMKVEYMASNKKRRRHFAP